MNDEATKKLKQKLISNVIAEYTTRDVLELVSKKIEKGNYIEAYAITDQYIEETIARLLIIKKEELTKIREDMNVKTTLNLIMRLGLVESFDIDYLDLINKFKKMRNKLIHNSIYSKPVKINKELKMLPRRIILRTDLFYFDTAINLIRLDSRIMQEHGKAKLMERWNFNQERLRYLLDFLLNLYFISVKKKKGANKEKLIGDFSTFLTRVFAEIVPFVEEKKLGIKRDYKEFADYTIKLIKRDLDEPSLIKEKVGT